MALRRLQALLPLGTQVRLTTDRETFDKYGRLLAYVMRGRQNINLAMVDSGWAVPYQIYPNLSMLDQLQACGGIRRLHEDAVRAGAGQARHCLDPRTFQHPLEAAAQAEGRFVEPDGALHVRHDDVHVVDTHGIDFRQRMRILLCWVFRCSGVARLTALVLESTCGAVLRC